MPDIDNVDMGSGLFMPFYFSYPYRFNYDFLKNFFYPFGFSRSYKILAEGSDKQFSQSEGSFSSSIFSAQAPLVFFTKGSTADYEKAFHNSNREAKKSAYERYFTDISENFSPINKTSDILKTADYQKSYLYSNREAFEENFVQDLYKSDFISPVEPKNTMLSNLPTKITEFTNRPAKITGFSNPPKAANFGFLQQLEIINSVRQNQRENTAFSKTYESALSTVSTFKKTPNFGTASGFSKSDYVSIFPSFRAENTPYESIENFTVKASENQAAILKKLSKQEQSFYLYGKNGNAAFQTLGNHAEKISGLVPLKFSSKSSEKSLEIGEQNQFQKPCQATPEKSLTTAGIDLDSLLEMICSALEEELNTCAEGVHL